MTGLEALTAVSCGLLGAAGWEFRDEILGRAGRLWRWWVLGRRYSCIPPGDGPLHVRLYWWSNWEKVRFKEHTKMPLEFTDEVMRDILGFEQDERDKPLP